MNITIFIFISMLIRNFIFAFIVFIMVDSCAYADKLIFASELIRHGERTPNNNLISLPDSHPLGFGKLTDKGIQQEYALGQQIKKQYVDRYKLLDKKYDVRTTYARSTDLDRTLMSANAFLIGMYTNNKKIQPYAIHTVALRGDNLLLGYEVNRDQVHTMALRNPEIAQYVKILESQLKTWSDLLGLKISSLEEMTSISDILYIRKQLKRPLPKDLSERDIAALHAIRNKMASLIFKPRNIGVLTTKDLINDIKNNIENVINENSSRKFVLYSAHDVTILGLLSLLGVPLDFNPPYASHVSMMLFKDGQENKKYRVEFLFNEKALNIPDCQNKTYCSLDEFQDLVKKVNLL